MAIQEYVGNEYFKKLIEDKIIAGQSLKRVLKEKGIIPVCTSTEHLSELVFFMIFGAKTMDDIHEVMNFEQNNLKSTMLIMTSAIKDKDKEDFVDALTDEFWKLQRLPDSKFQFRDLRKEDGAILLQYWYEKPVKGRYKLASNRTITLDVAIKPITKGKYKVSIQHEGASDSKPFIGLLDRMAVDNTSEKVFDMHRITLDKLSKSNRVDFFDEFGKRKYSEWKVIDITNVTVNHDDTIDDENLEAIELEKNENAPTGRLTGISSAILNGGGLRNNQFVKECMSQGFVFSSMRFKLSNTRDASTIELEVNFKQSDLKINIIKTYMAEDDGKDHIVPFSHDEQSRIISYFQMEAYQIYEGLRKKQNQV